LEIVLAIVGGLCLLSGFALAFGGSSLPLTPVNRARKGDRVRIAGRITAHKPLTSPIASEACAYWKLAIEATVSRSTAIEEMLVAVNDDDEEGQPIRAAAQNASSVRREWADGLCVVDDTGQLLLDPINGRIDTGRGTRLVIGMEPDERAREIIRHHAASGVESNVRSLEEGVLPMDTPVVVEGVVEDIKGRLFLGGETRFSVELAASASTPSALGISLGRGLLVCGVLCVVGFVILEMT
jgi:hypothetical protein